MDEFAALVFISSSLFDGNSQTLKSAPRPLNLRDSDDQSRLKNFKFVLRKYVKISIINELLIIMIIRISQMQLRCAKLRICQVDVQNYYF